MLRKLVTMMLIMGLASFIQTGVWGEEAAALQEPAHVCVHDPSIFEDQDGMFYIVGSHTASAASEDLVAWKQLNFDYGNGKNLPFYGNLQETLAKPFAWAGFDDGDCAGNGYAVWAPDLIWNPFYIWNDGEEGAYMLYLCTSSTWRRSCISYLVARDVLGPYEFVDTIVYSGFTKNGEYDGKSTRDTTWSNDYLNLAHLVDLGAENGGIDEISDNWFNADGSWNHTYAPNAIDPNLFFDASGEKLYMSYGSWSGGMFLLELDRETGAAKYPGTDGTDEASGNFVDRYFGVHLIGGDHQSGEGPYISYDAETGYYYLYCTYGGLASSGGYNMRLFRSENVTGPYLDAAGNNAADNKVNGDKYGIKLIGNYVFHDQIGKRAAGHNSQLNASDGSRYLVYHQRFDIKPQLEAHEVRVHQQFMNEDLWPVTAVYEYRGEQPEHYEMDELVGTYEFINHGRKSDGDMLETVLITLEEDGSVSGPVTGTWEASDSGKGYDFAALTLSDVTYHGIFFRQHKENASAEPVMTFTAIGTDNTCIWGSKADAENGEMVAGIVADALKKVIMETSKAHGQLPDEMNGCEIRWESSDTSVITEDGVILTPSDKVKVDLTAVITSGETMVERTYHVTVKP
ncbi:MAG: glycoside hydrolase family 43 protein [Blautia sp.]|nr:glycoside hydrolase family 43 protein [Blautia sp.]